MVVQVTGCSATAMRCWNLQTRELFAQEPSSEHSKANEPLSSPCQFQGPFLLLQQQLLELGFL